MNSEPDEYNCACSDSYSGKNCEIGESVKKFNSVCANEHGYMRTIIRLLWIIR
jgi:hypothetical protein